MSSYFSVEPQGVRNAGSRLEEISTTVSNARQYDDVPDGYPAIQAAISTFRAGWDPALDKSILGVTGLGQVVVSISEVYRRVDQAQADSFTRIRSVT